VTSSWSFICQLHGSLSESTPHTGNNSCYTSSKFIHTIYVHCNNTLCWENRRINLQWPW